MGEFYSGVNIVGMVKAPEFTSGFFWWVPVAHLFLDFCVVLLCVFYVLSSVL